MFNSSADQSLPEKEERKKKKTVCPIKVTMKSKWTFFFYEIFQYFL